MGDATVTYTIGNTTKMATLTTSDTTGTFNYTGSYLIAAGDSGAVGFTKVNFATAWNLQQIILDLHHQRGYY